MAKRGAINAPVLIFLRVCADRRCKVVILLSFEIKISGRLFARKGVSVLELIEMKQHFIKSVVRVVAKYGLEKTTTKAIAAEAKLNEAYIYKCFSGKDELLWEALHMEDVNFAVLLHETLPVMQRSDIPWKERAFILWKTCWDFILEEPDDCIFYIRYYFSACCLGSTHQSHMRDFQPIIEKTRPSFKEGTHMDMLIHQIFSTMLFFASRVMSNDLENNEATTKWTFEQIYSFIAPNVRPELLKEGLTE